MKMLQLVPAVLALALSPALLFAQTPPPAQDGISFELQPYKAAGNRLSVNLPMGWTARKLDHCALYLTTGTVAFGITPISGRMDVAALPGWLSDIAETMESTASITKVRLVDQPVFVKGPGSQQAHAGYSYLLDRDEYYSDIYLKGGADHKARYAMVTFVPLDKRDAYRPLFNAVVDSIAVDENAPADPDAISWSTWVRRVFGEGAGAARAVFEDYAAVGGRIALPAPAGWKKTETEGCLLSMTDGAASLGLMEPAARDRRLSPLELLPEIIRQFRERGDFTELQVLEEPERLRGKAHARSLVTYKQGEKLLAASLYAFGSDKGSDFILMTFAPREEMRNYISLFDRMAGAVKLNAAAPAAAAKQEADVAAPTPKAPVAVEENSGEVTTATRTRLHPIYWIRDGKRIVRDGKPLFQDSAGIQRARVSWGGKHILYVRNNYKDLVLVNLSTLKPIRLYSVAGKTTVNFEGGSKERETLSPVGFSPDDKRVYFIKQLSSVYVGGNELFSISVNGGKPKQEFKGLADAALASNGNLLICKPGAVLVKEASGNTWEYEAQVRALFLSGVGYTVDDQPFYYTDSSVRLFSRKAPETTIRVRASIAGRPIVFGKTLVWASRGKIMSTESGEEKAIDLDGRNEEPFN